MRKVSAPVLFVLALLAVAAVGGATFGVAVLAGLTDDDAVTVDGPTTSVVPGTDERPLAADQVAVSGTATDVAVEGVRIDPLPTPLTVTTPERGFGAGARVTDVAVDGEGALVTWDAGRPFVLEGEAGSLLPGYVNVYLAPAAVVVGFPDRGAHGFRPGAYRLATPVAVSHGAGLGESRDGGVDFDATDSSTVSFTGGASTVVPVAERDFVGPGRVVLRGAGLSLRHPDGTVTSPACITLAQGSFELTTIPLVDGSGWEVRAVLEGAVDETTCP